jgi:Zn-dependent M32 family carboxypeptidase|tara:strand:- start:1431 stop:1814 length:384 start_codon:yes stop_codon:yes gene_type:complete
MKLRERIKKLFKFGRTNMAEAQVKNYTDEMVATMIDQYTATPTRATVDALADEFGKTARSIIAKLSREGVYVAQPKTTKSGTPIVRKAEIVARIAGQLGVELEAPSLVKASKLDLLMLEDAIVKATS